MESYDKMEILFSKPKPIENLSDGEQQITYIEQEMIVPNMSRLISESQQPIEESSTSLTVDLNQDLQRKPVELIIPHLDIESSTSTVIAQVSPMIAGLQTKIDVPSDFEKSSSNFTKHIESSTSTIIADIDAKLETKDKHANEIISEEFIRPHPQVQESTSIMLADVHSTLDTSQKHMTIPTPLQHPLDSSSQVIIKQDNIKAAPIASHLHQQPSLLALMAKLDNRQIKNSDMYILGIDNQQEQQFTSSTMHAGVNQPVEFVFNVDGSNASTVSQQYRQDYNTRLLTSAANGTDKSFALNTGKFIIFTRVLLILTKRIK